jgi:hypothetical protein
VASEVSHFLDRSVSMAGFELGRGSSPLGGWYLPRVSV